MEAVEALAIVSGHVEEELLIRNEYLAAENQILTSKLKGPVRFNDYERIQNSVTHFAVSLSREA